MRYISKMNVQALIAAARTELKPSKPEAYKAFLLGLFAGLRRKEIDLAEWRMIDWQNNLLRVEETDWLGLKTNTSAGVIYLDPEVLAELRELKPPIPGPFIVCSLRRPKNDSSRPYYRCKPVFRELAVWLRGKGITANKPLHELRKELGAIIVSKHGIYAASRFLRHSDITTTARHYADQKTRISAGIGNLLNTEIAPAVGA